MKLGFKVGFMTTLGVLTAYALFQLGAQALVTFVLAPLVNLLGL